MKGGGAGGGKSQVMPAPDINMHFTGDIHAVSSAYNLLTALDDNHLHHGNALGLDSRRVVWRRVLDMNDRALRDCVIGLGGHREGVPRETGFDISAASEVMAILCLSRDYADLKRRLGNILVGFAGDGSPVFARDLLYDERILRSHKENERSLAQVDSPRRWGYEITNVARAWTLAWATMNNVDPPDELPEAFLEQYPLEEFRSRKLRDEEYHEKGARKEMMREEVERVVARINKEVFPLIDPAASQIP